MQLKNDLLLRTANGEITERTPVWVMRQAGRILPEYREVRSKLNGFKELVKSPEFACEVTIQPVDILGVDAAIIFSDILVIPEAMGVDYIMEEKKGPVFPDVVVTKADIDKVRIATADDLNYVIDAIKLTKKELNNRVPLIGFVGAPWTLFAYMTEGSGSKTFTKPRSWLYNQPENAHALLEKITLSTINYAKAQVAAGANLIQIFDSWAGILPPHQYSEFSLKYISRICDAIKDVPVTVFAKGAFFAREELSKINCNVIGLDWNMGIEESRKIIGTSKVLQGNLDPCALFGTFSEVKKATEMMIDQFGTTKHIANLGHGVYPETDKDKVKCFIDTVKEYSSNLKFN